MSLSCRELGEASIRCIEEHGYNRSAPECQHHFEAYKECKREMTEERRRERMAGSKGIFS